MSLFATMRDDHVVEDSAAGAHLHQILDAMEARRPIEDVPLLVEYAIHLLGIFTPPFLLDGKVLLLLVVNLRHVD